MTDFIIILRTKSAIQTFSGNVHFSVGAGLSAAAGTVGRAAEAGLRAGDGGYAACYTYSCSKGNFSSGRAFTISLVFYIKSQLFVASSHHRCRENLADASLNSFWKEIEVRVI